MDHDGNPQQPLAWHAWWPTEAAICADAGSKRSWRVWFVGVKLMGICFVHGSIRHSILCNDSVLVGM